ncbi:MAG: hypothetical protein K2Z80_01060 [Xanthobacteraceae bacterium]|nr:hypothetical protein [Xanthobacteraceae bacterium]
MRVFFLVSLFAFGTGSALTSGPAAARTSHHHVTYSHHALTTETTQVGKYRARRSAAVEKKRAYRKHAAAKGRPAARSDSVSLAGVTPVLAAKARAIAAACGSSVISAVSSRGNRSNHPIGRAVDMRGNPSCIYAQLKGWPGGYSTDYRSAGHVHISYNPGGQEWGVRFAHGGHSASHIASARARGINRLAGAHNVYASAHDVYGAYNVGSVRRTARRGMARTVPSPAPAVRSHRAQ